ncbi:MAG: 3'-5' exonuclease, partial [Psychromonas sp.]
NSRLRYNLPTYAPHDALTDAIATAELFQAQIKYHFSEDTAIKTLWL